MKAKSIRNKPKILVILGPTATGKSDLAVKLARKFNGEVISADSRQVYTGLDIGTGKITKKEMLGVPHHMLDVVSPKKVFTVSQWKEKTEKILGEIISRGKLPIICGGTGLYIKSIVDNIVFPEVPPNPALRKKLEKKSASELFTILKKLDLVRAKTIEKENPVRLIRAIEIATALGSVPKIKTGKNPYDILQIGLALPDVMLRKKIHDRIVSRLKKGMAKEAETLHKTGLSWKRMRELGLEYRWLANYLQRQPLKASSHATIARQAGHSGRMTKLTSSGEVGTERTNVNVLEIEIWHYAKRQMTWFKRDKKIGWYSPSETRGIERELKSFLQ